MPTWSVEGFSMWVEVFVMSGTAGSGCLLVESSRAWLVLDWVGSLVRSSLDPLTYSLEQRQIMDSVLWLGIRV